MPSKGSAEVAQEFSYTKTPRGMALSNEIVFLVKPGAVKLLLDFESSNGNIPEKTTLTLQSFRT